MATYGEGIGRYLGLNFAPDAILVASTNQLKRTQEFAAFAALHLPVSSNLRLNLIGSYQHDSYPDGFIPTAFTAFNRESLSGAGNLFYTPLKNVDFGIEYRHGYREIVSGASGTLNRLELSAKYGF